MHALATLLSYEWLDDNLINAGSDWIMQQLGGDCRIQILNCLIPTQLRHRCSTKTLYHPAKDTALDQCIRTGELDVLLLPLHIHGNHSTLR